MDARQAYPVRIEGELEPELSRWLWLVKWVLAIPHYIVLGVPVADAPRADGRSRSSRSSSRGAIRGGSSTSTSACSAGRGACCFYSYGALGTDRYPPFTLDDVPDYPAPARRRVSGAALTRARAREVVAARDPALHRRRDHPRRRELRGVARLRPGVGLRLPDRARRGPRALRGRRAALHVALSAGDLRLRAGARPLGRARRGVRASDARRVPAVPARPGRGGDSAAAEAEPIAAARPPSPKSPRRKSAEAAGLRGRSCCSSSASSPGSWRSLSSSAAARLVAVDQTQRDDDGFLMSPSVEFSTPTYAVVSESADLDTDWSRVGAGHVPRYRSHPQPRATARCSSESARRPRSTAYLQRRRARRRRPTSTAGTRRTRDDAGGAPSEPTGESRRSGPRRPPERASRRSSGSPRTATGARS